MILTGESPGLSDPHVGKDLFELLTVARFQLVYEVPDAVMQQITGRSSILPPVPEKVPDGDQLDPGLLCDLERELGRKVF